jgi:hypothetical protein
MRGDRGAGKASYAGDILIAHDHYSWLNARSTSRPRDNASTNLRSLARGVFTDCVLVFVSWPVTLHVRGVHPLSLLGTVLATKGAAAVFYCSWLSHTDSAGGMNLSGPQ